MQSDKPSNILGAALRKTGAAGGVLLAFGFVVNLLYLATPLYMMQLFDRVLASQRLETLVALTLIAVFALAVLGALETVRGRIATRTSEWLDETLGRHVIDASVSAAVAGSAPGAQGVRDVHPLRGFITGGLRAMPDLPWTPRPR